MKIAIQCFSLVYAAVLLAACEGLPVAPSGAADAAPTSDITLQSHSGAERLIEESLYDVGGVLVQFTCDDGSASELIAMEGQIYERFSLAFNPAGGIHVTTHTMPIGLRGIGTESGEEYRVKEQEHFTGNQTVMGVTGSYRQKISLVARDSKRRFEWTVKGHYTMNANGEWTVERETEAAECGS